jgi:hypothetical protein
MPEDPKPRIVIGINSLVSTVHAAYSNHVQLFFKLGRKYKDEWDFIFINPPRMSIDRMRNMAAEVALQADAKYLIFIDDDVLIPFDFLDKFLIAIKQGNHVVCGNVQIRGYPFDYMMFRWDEKKTGLFTLKELAKTGLEEVDAVGFSCVIIDVEKCIRPLSRPYFITTYNMTEDVTFCLKLMDEQPDVKMVCDPSIVCGHILWSEIISEANRDNYTKYYESQYPEETAAARQKIEKDRGQSYLDKLKAAAGVS